VRYGVLAAARFGVSALLSKLLLEGVEPVILAGHGIRSPHMHEHPHEGLRHAHEHRPDPHHRHNHKEESSTPAALND